VITYKTLITKVHVPLANKALPLGSKSKKTATTTKDTCYPLNMYRQTPNKTLQGTSSQRGFSEFSLATKASNKSKFSAASPACP